MFEINIDGRHRNAHRGTGLDILVGTAEDDEFIFNSAAMPTSQNKSAARPNPDLVEHPGKIGIGTWDLDGLGTALSDLRQFDFSWYTNWGHHRLWSAGGAGRNDERFVPMIWGRDEIATANFERLASAPSGYLLGFNEPDNAGQSNLSVGEALKLWPKLMDKNLELGSPACTQTETLGDDSWLGRFMDKADRKDYQVDFVAVHYYSDDGSVADFKAFLKDVRQEYHKPVWVTEWALVDWADRDRFTADEAADFAAEAIQMMDDLKFVKRHAWFGAYEAADGWNFNINTELIDAAGNLTAVGHVFQELTM
ncbi:RNA polymerase subunit sigma-24 [Rhizobium sp. TH2]|uniref:glycoside hydrolase family protein n=1 Tax=Rhizobium sp. TH2 TaxID=2775403 RepID=UPI002157CD09|nr:glycoside hydrolase family protein [Rhizobium sp. TH2]UVC07709.1 RNA polymerase subunit sigma-24 [Rhizobium sp. TH2]